MKKWNSIQGLALTSVLIALAGCDENKKQSDIAEEYVMPAPIAGMLAEQMKDASMTAQEKLHMTAAQLDLITTETIHGTLAGKVPPHETGAGFVITGDFLWWKADEDGLDYAIKVKSPSVGATTSKYEYGSTNGRWKPGFRFGVGGMFGDSHDNWDIYLNWTHFNSRSMNHMRQKAPANFVSALWTPQLLTGDLVTSSQQKWKLHYNTLDFELGRDYFISADITLRPHLGLRGASIDQKVATRYTSTLIEAAGTFAGLKQRFNGKNDYEAVGMRTGADFVWHFSSNIGLFGQFSGSLLYGRFDTKQTIRYFAPTAAAPVLTTAKEKRNLWRTRANIQGAIGLTFEEVFSVGKYRFSLNLAYEFLEWFQQNMLNTKTFYPTEGLGTDSAIGVQTAYGDLGLQGFTADVQLDF